MTVVHCKRSAYTHYIGRPSLLGNPFSHKQGTAAFFIVPTVEDAINKFETWAQTRADVMQAIKNLPEDAVLGCWCKIKGTEPCHGDVIVKLWKRLHNKI